MAEGTKMKEQAKPLALPSPTIHPTTTTTTTTDEEEEAAVASQFRYARKRRRALCFCCGCCAATTLVVGVLILVLFLTVFKVKDPSLTMNSLSIDSFDMNLGSNPNGQRNLVSANVTLTADISIKNPNAASFRFGSSATEFYYEGSTVGVAYAPAGRVGADRTVRMNVTVDVLADQLFSHSDALSTIIMGGNLDLTTHTDVAGRVNVLGIYKRHLKISMNCTVVLQVSLSSAETQSTTCDGNVN